MAMNRPVPEADPVAYARMKYELENRENPGIMQPRLGIFSKSPDVDAWRPSPARRRWTSLRPTVPAQRAAPGGRPGSQRCHRGTGARRDRGDRQGFDRAG